MKDEKQVRCYIKVKKNLGKKFHSLGVLEKKQFKRSNLVETLLFSWGQKSVLLKSSKFYAPWKLVLLICLQNTQVQLVVCLVVYYF